MTEGIMLFEKNKSSKHMIYNTEITILEGGNTFPNTMLKIELTERKSSLEPIKDGLTAEIFEGIVRSSLGSYAMLVVFIDMQGIIIGHIASKNATIKLENIQSIYLGYDLQNELSHIRISIDKHTYEN